MWFRRWQGAVVLLALGEVFSCALTSAGGVKCWGWNVSTLGSQREPVDVSGLSSGVLVQAGAVTLVAGGGTDSSSGVVGHVCAVMVGGGVKCLGMHNSNGSHLGIGDGTGYWRTTAVDVSGLSSGVTALASGANHTCALQAGGVKCWGKNVSGQLGDGTVTNRLTPVSVGGLSSGVAQLAAYDHTCAVTEGGGLKCWGYNNQGQLGDGTETNRYAPVAVDGLSSGVAAVAAGSTHTCALTSGGAVLCWGRGGEGQVGDGALRQRLTPADVAGFGRTNVIPTVTPTVQPTATPAPAGFNYRAQAVAAGQLHSCAVTDGGGVRCWGSNDQGQLGDGTVSYQLTPVSVVGLNSGVVLLAVADSTSCALTSAGGVKCWGGNNQQREPVDVSGLSSGVLVQPGAVTLAGV